MGLCATCINLDVNKDGCLICKLDGEILQYKNGGCEDNYEESEYLENEQEPMTEKQKHTCFDCKHHYYEEEWNGEEEFMITECLLGNEPLFFDEFECEDFEDGR